MARNFAANFSKFMAGSNLPDANPCRNPNVLHADSQILNPARGREFISPGAGNFFALVGKFMGRAGNSPGFTESGIGLRRLKRTTAAGRFARIPGLAAGLLEQRLQHLSNRTRLASAGIFSCGHKETKIEENPRS
jgi:hypothetical protein